VAYEDRRKCKVNPDRSTPPRPELLFNHLQFKLAASNLSADRTVGRRGGCSVVGRLWVSGCGVVGEFFGFGCGVRGLGGFSVWAMANQAISKQARRAAREAAAAAQEELARRTRANVEDLATFFSAREREEAVESWLAARVQDVMAQAAVRRRQARVAGGRALRAMRERGQSLREIAGMAGVGEKTVRALIREADAAGDAPVLPPGDADRGGDGDGAQGAPVGARAGGPQVSESDQLGDGLVGAGVWGRAQV
jgi:hypothetical protein